MILERGEASAIFAGGCLGALLRVVVEDAVPHAGFPWATLLVNVVGALLLGVVIARATDLQLPLWGSGFCGALTTFATFQLELFDLLDDGATGTALAYAAASLALGLVAFDLGSRA